MEINKAIEHKLQFIIFVNKIDREIASPEEALNDFWNYALKVDETGDILESTVFYGSGKDAYMSTDLAVAKEKNCGLN